MLEHHPSEITEKNETINDDEIDLVELVAILYRRRWLMVGVFVFIVGLAVAYCFIATPKYQISAQISPGITGYADNGQPVNAWSAKDIQNWYTQKAYEEALVAGLGDDEEIPEIEAGNTRESNLINLNFDWPNPAQGKQLLQATIDFLIQRGNKSIQQLIGSRRAFQDEIFQLEKDIEQIPIERDRLKDEVLKTQQKLAVDQQTLEHEILKLEKELEQIPLERTRIDNQIAKAKNKIKVLDTKLTSIEKNKVLAKQASDIIKARIDRVNDNTEELMQLQKSSFSVDSDRLALLMYSNIVQQNIGLAISLQNRLEGLEKEINQYVDEDSARNSEIDDTKLEIQNLELKRDKELSFREAEIKKNILKTKAELEKTSKEAEIKIQELKIKRNQELTMKNDKLQENIENLKTRLTTLTPVEVSQLPFSSPEPVKPAKIKIVAVAILLSGFLSVFTAFLYEFWIKNRVRVMAKSTKPNILAK